MIKILFAAMYFIALSCLPPTAFADIAPDPLTGGKALNNFGFNATDVRMVSENVMVRIFENEIKTTAEFKMYNEGETIMMDVGFPYYYEGDFIEFRAFVDDREVIVRDTVETDRKTRPIPWKLWKVTFEKKKTCSIRVEYTTKPYGHEYILVEPEKCARIPYNVIKEAQLTTKKWNVFYWLETGSDWKNVLKSCRIEFELVGKSAANILSYHPGNGRLTDNGVVWEYENYDPVGEVSMQYYYDIAVKDVPPYLLDLFNKYPNNPYLAESIGEILKNDLNKKEMANEVYYRFLSNWDGKVPQLMEYASGGRCRYNFRGKGGDFYTRWKIAKILFSEYEREGQTDRVADVAQNVFDICSAMIDSLNTCANLPESNKQLYNEALNLLHQSARFVKTGGQMKE